MTFLKLMMFLTISGNMVGRSKSGCFFEHDLRAFQEQFNIRKGLNHLDGFPFQPISEGGHFTETVPLSLSWLLLPRHPAFRPPPRLGPFRGDEGVILRTPVVHDVPGRPGSVLWGDWCRLVDCLGMLWGDEVQIFGEDLIF